MLIDLPLTTDKELMLIKPGPTPRTRRTPPPNSLSLNTLSSQPNMVLKLEVSSHKVVHEEWQTNAIGSAFLLLNLPGKFVLTPAMFFCSMQKERTRTWEG